MLVKLKDGRELTVKDAMDILKMAIQKDHSYAWGWHCNLACMSMDAGSTHEVANDGAARFMSLCFGVDTSKFDEYMYKKG